MSTADRDKHLTTLCDMLAAEERGPPTQKRAHLLTYATVLSGQPSIADFMVNRDLVNRLAKQLKDAHHIDLLV